jgi:hypothetical protein
MNSNIKSSLLSFKQASWHVTDNTRFWPGTPTFATNDERLSHTMYSSLKGSNLISVISTQ